MELTPKSIKSKFPKIGETADSKDPIVVCKYFLPGSGWTWYAIEYDGNNLFYGYVIGYFPELGYFSLNELKKLKGMFNLAVERDLYFDPKPLSEIKKIHE